MPELHKVTKLPLAALFYEALPHIVLALLIPFFGTVFSLLLKQGEAMLCVERLCDLLPSSVVIPALFVIAILIIVEPVIRYVLFSYQLAEHTITINSGIIFRQYETIDFSRIQAVDNERNPLLFIFGLTELKIWTASMDQLDIDTTEGSVHMRPQADTRLLLRSDTAETLKTFMMNAKHSKPL